MIQCKSMTNPNVGVGSQVYFRSFVYDAPFSPYFDNYKGHKFTVVRFGDERSGEDPDSVELRGPVIVNGMVETGLLKLA